MSQPIASTSIDNDLVFYVNERGDGDEFTFYLDQSGNKTVVNKLKEKLPKTLKTALESGTKEMLSFAERVFVKNLFLTKNSLKWSENVWTKLTSDEHYEDLAKRLKAKQPGVTSLQKPDDAKAFLKQIANVLNEMVEGEDLAQQPWASNNLPNESDVLEKLPEDDPLRQRWRNRLILERSFPELIKEKIPGRGLICYSYVGQYLSVTFRKISDDQGYAALDFSDETERQENLFSLSEYCELLYTEIFKNTDSAEHAHGLVVITGATKSAKSEIARGLIELYLQGKEKLHLNGKEKLKRRYHLVTFEDPVERFYVYERATGYPPWVAVQLSKNTDAKTLATRDYTPRQKEKDANLLQEALSDALRQTPALFFVGETRNREEWKVLLDFAATGHLIMTTAHAGSLVEAMHKIFEALDVKTAADRSEIANKLLGVVHLRRDELEFVDSGEKKRTGSLFPALWRRTPRGIASLTSDGLASLLPYRPKKTSNGTKEDAGSTAPAAVDTEKKDRRQQQVTEKHDHEGAASCLGRRWIVEELTRPKTTSEQIEKVFKADAKELKKQAYEKATEWDLQGV